MVAKDMTIHGVVQEQEIHRKSNGMEPGGTLNRYLMAPADHDIAIPKVVRNKSHRPSKSRSPPPAPTLIRTPYRHSGLSTISSRTVQQGPKPAGRHRSRSTRHHPVSATFKAWIIIQSKTRGKNVLHFVIAHRFGQINDAYALAIGQRQHAHGPRHITDQLAVGIAAAPLKPTRPTSSGGRCGKT